MDGNQPKPLTDEERQAVEKAMREFAPARWNIYAPKEPKHKQKSHRLPFPIWSVPVAVGVAILIPVLLIGFPPSGKDAPTESTPTIGETHETQTGNTEELIMPPVPPTTQQIDEPTVPVPPTTQATEITEPPTQPTTPPVEVPAGTPLTFDEIYDIQRFFHDQSVYSCVCAFSFSDPRELELQHLINIDFSSLSGSNLTQTEKDYLAGISKAYANASVRYMSQKDVSSTLMTYYGLSINDIPSAKDAVYWSGRYYFIGGSRFINRVVINQGVLLNDGTIWLRCTNFTFKTTNEMIIKPVIGGYHILSNQVYK